MFREFVEGGWLDVILVVLIAMGMGYVGLKVAESPPDVFGFYDGIFIGVMVGAIIISLVAIRRL